jgi:hypothetical protein
MELVIVVIVLWVVPGYICYEQGKTKHRLGLAWGLLGWLGVLALAVLPAGPERPRFADRSKSDDDDEG